MKVLSKGKLAHYTGGRVFHVKHETQSAGAAVVLHWSVYINNKDNKGCDYLWVSCKGAQIQALGARFFWG